MQKLNFPSYAFMLRNNKGVEEIYCKNRKKWLKLTPEEWVRQNSVEFLIQYCKVKPELIANEMSLSLNGMTKRCDTVVFNSKMKPILLCEYKASSVVLNQKVFDQIFSYNRELGVPLMLVTNGLQHICLDLSTDSLKQFPITELTKKLTLFV